MLAVRAIGGPCVFGVDKSVLGCNVDTPSSLFTAFRQRFYDASLAPCDLDPRWKGTCHILLRPTQAGRSNAFQTLKSDFTGEALRFPQPCERRFACSRLLTINSSVHSERHTNRKPEATEYSSPCLFGHSEKGCCSNLRIRGRHRVATCSAKKGGGGEPPKDEDKHKKVSWSPSWPVDRINKPSIKTALDAGSTGLQRTAQLTPCMDLCRETLSGVVAVFWLACRPAGAGPSFFIADAKVSPKLQRSGKVLMHDAKDI
jgi:hypothetical protein